VGAGSRCPASCLLAGGMHEGEVASRDAPPEAALVQAATLEPCPTSAKASNPRLRPSRVVADHSFPGRGFALRLKMVDANLCLGLFARPR